MSEFDRTKWNQKYQDSGDVPLVPSAVITSLGDLLPRQGRALDVAGGSGRHAIWLAKRGFDVTLADVSEIGLSIANQHATQAGVEIVTQQIDLEAEAFPAGGWDLILSVCYLCRQLFEGFSSSLASDGLLVVLQPTRRNLERHQKPPERFLLDEGELPKLAVGLEIVRYEEGWLADGRHDALLVARRTE